MLIECGAFSCGSIKGTYSIIKCTEAAEMP